MRLTLIPTVVFILLINILSVHATAVPQLVNYQGKVYQPSGAAVPDGVYKVRFAIYEVPTAGDALWTETYDTLQVKGSSFHVLLGSINPIGASIFSSADRYLGVKLGNDPELSPRQKIASVPFAMVAQTVPDASITPAKLTSAALTPPGVIVMWSGAANAIPSGWALCDGASATPDLRDRFVVGAGSTYAVGATGGEATHKLTVEETPTHSHAVQMHNTGSEATGAGLVTSLAFQDRVFVTGGSNIGTDNTGGDQPHENRPPYYALCFIMKLGY